MSANAPGQAAGIDVARSDAIVVGAGIVGAACARRLAEAGLRVTVLEREAAPATHSTGRSAAGIRVQFSEAVNVLLSAASLDEYRAMPEAAYRPVGYLFFVPPALWPAHLEGYELQRSLGMPVERLTPEQAARIVPARIDDIAGATWCPADGVLDPHGIAMAFLAEARRLGAAVRLNAPAQAIANAGSPAAARWQVRTPAGTFEAPVLVNCAGAWSGEVGRLAGLEVPVGPARRIVFATGPRVEPRVFPLTVDAGTGFWFRSEGQRLIFGLSNPEDTGFEEGIDWPWLETAYPVGLERFPWFETLDLDRKASWWGYYEVTPDHQPVVGPMPGAPGWFNACGFSGHGVQQAAAIGRVVAAQVRGQQPFVDVSSLSIERFAAGAPAKRESLIV
ncbi:FAD-binding oxidoreductase [Burkholderiaceae bacterium FT117]|uniref:NAD(P)/FAD-dependent oxidoreductase n=1 Tax=Zeimonas sediminis TaxID=2944268 RepID=UPI002342C5E7|nr:FAD-dependent oxidoreductase [Zeimonas sediminis]MCM5570356.1 FAD-binding oxidoreductase [Zeimonas sediminis]